MNAIAESVKKTEASLGFKQALLSESPRITSFLLKVTARCNLNCDYCYVFNHADQSWKQMPSALRENDQDLFADRLADYIKTNQIERCLVVFHGGEPLLIGVERLLGIVQKIRKVVPTEAIVDFSLQTNGTLLTREKIELLSSANIGVSLSLDGPAEVNDLHRLTPKGNSSFSKVLKAFYLLKEYPNIFNGVIGVVDGRASPKTLFEFFAPLDPPQLDFLLPDANHLNPPPLRAENPDIYINWLKEAFDLWYDVYPDLKIRYFDELLGAIAGLPSGTDAFGLGDVSLLTVETDGFYHDLDVLKITEEGQSSLGQHLRDFSIDDIIRSEKIQNHRRLLRFEGLSSTCQSCPEVAVCGGGAVPHRYGTNGFDNPTVYCREMLSLIQHARRRVQETIGEAAPLPHSVQGSLELVPSEILSYEQTSSPNTVLDTVYGEWSKVATENFLRVLLLAHAHGLCDQKDLDFALALPHEKLQQIATVPSVLFWAKIAENEAKKQKTYDLDGKPIQVNGSHLHEFIQKPPSQPFFIHEEDPLLRSPFGKSIAFEEGEFVVLGRELTLQALGIIENLSPSLLEEMRKLSPCIQFVRDLTAHPDKIVSFSDNIFQGALFVSIRKGNELLDPYDLADSLIHEHRHQKLYLLEQFVPVVLSDTPLVYSPWRQETRPVSGVFHGSFVFHQLKNYWKMVSKNSTGKLREKANKQVDFCVTSLGEGLQGLKNSPITEAGRILLSEFGKQQQD